MSRYTIIVLRRGSGIDRLKVGLLANLATGEGLPETSLGFLSTLTSHS